MAFALRPAVLLMLVASVLFVLAGALEGVYPGGPDWSLDAYGGLGWTSHLFGIVNLIVAILIARGSERILALRIGLAAFFVVERTVTAFALGPKPAESVAVHLLTAVVEAVILVTTLRVWRLGHSVTQTDLTFLSVKGVTPAVAVAGTGGGAIAGGQGTAIPAPPTAPARAAKAPRPMAQRVAPLIAPRASAVIGALALLLALILVADAVAAGAFAGGALDLASPEWLGFLLALVVLGVAARAVHGARFALRLLLVVALIVLVERAFTPIALRIGEAVALGLHFAAALVALGLAITAAAALRSTRARPVAPTP